MITLPAELDRLLPTEAQSIALERLRPVMDQDDQALFPGPVVVGPLGSGELTINAKYFYTASTGAHYVHIKLPFTTAAEARWFVKVWGSSNTFQEIVDLTYIGRVSGSALSANVELDPTATIAPLTYVGSGNDIYLRFKPTDIAETTIIVHYMRHTVGARVLPDDITITTSASATL